MDATGCLVRHTKIKRIVYGGPSYLGDGGYLFDPHGDLRAWRLYP